MGDTVNLASRLEGANKFYGTEILASEAVHAAAGREFHWREIDLVRVKGREAPVRIFAPLESDEPAESAFAAALAAYRAGDFARAAALLETEASTDPAAAAFARRLRGLSAAAPGWAGINVLDTK
jgi:adenylate cyclase